MVTKRVRSRFDHKIGETVEGCIIVEKTVVIPPDLLERRRGVYDYLVEVTPATAQPQTPKKPIRSAEPSSFTRSTPEERLGGSVRRFPSR